MTVVRGVKFFRSHARFFGPLPQQQFSSFLDLDFVLKTMAFYQGLITKDEFLNEKLLHAV